MNIRPSSELRNNYSTIMRMCRETGEPIFLTVNGKGDSVIMSIEDYNRLYKSMQLEQLLTESDEDVKSNDFIEAQQVFSDLNNKLGIKK